MTMLSQSILFLQKDSIFAKKYFEGTVKKTHYWDPFYEDSLNLLAKIPRLAARVYRHKYYNNDFIKADNSLDWAGNYAHMLGYK
jgi:citrate synthase